MDTKRRRQLEGMVDRALDDMLDDLFTDVGDAGAAELTEVLKDYDLEDAWNDYLRDNEEDEAALAASRSTHEPSKPFSLQAVIDEQKAAD